MTCSDNVIHGGLTPKLRDTNVLCQIVDYVAQEPPVSNGQVISHHKRLVSYYLCSPCLCYYSFGLVRNSDIIDLILISKWFNQCIYILDEESEEYDDTNNDNKNYEGDNNENTQNKTIPMDEVMILKMCMRIITVNKKLERMQLDMMQMQKHDHQVIILLHECVNHSYLTINWHGCYQPTATGDCVGKKHRYSNLC